MRDELEHLLDDDMDMSEMYLTRKLAFQGFTETWGTMDANKDAPTDHHEMYVITAVDARMRMESKLIILFLGRYVTEQNRMSAHRIVCSQPIPHA